MGEIYSSENVTKLSEILHSKPGQLVLVGGCFDILHIGHLTFLKEAKKKGDILVILLESDETIRESKGPKRPINLQTDRAELLCALRMVDYVITLPPAMTNAQYDDLVISLKPAIIATTEGDPTRHHKQRQAELVKGMVIDVTPPIRDKSTSHVVALLDEL